MSEKPNLKRVNYGSYLDQMSRDLDPNIPQRQASEPYSSVWVSASAGTGKTKVLTDRVLRLLLPRDQETAGTTVHKILCLTFTKAAASEMSLRIAKKLSSWSIMKDDLLRDELRPLLGREIYMSDLQAARRLFARVTDEPGGLQIMTIHAFCQSVLGRFPLEAGLSPNFQALDETQAASVLLQAKSKALAQAYKDADPNLRIAIDHIAKSISEDQFLKLLKDFVKEKRQFSKVLSEFWNVDGVYSEICRVFSIETSLCTHDLIQNAVERSNSYKEILKDLCVFLEESDKKTDLGVAQRIRDWFLAHEMASTYPKSYLFENYCSIFLTQKNEPRQTLITKGHGKTDPLKYERFLEFQAQESYRLQEILETLKKIECAQASKHLFVLCQEILKIYEDLKHAQNALDFDDLILKTLDLLQGHEGSLEPHLNTMRGWVLYKMDQGIDHILIDEAQDTNPEQWAIIEALCDEFFAGQNARDDVNRTVFTVGDEKQSIYSFQRASPEEFEKMQIFFQDRVEQAKERWNAVDMNISFRSVKSVLAAVDAVFSRPGLCEDSGFNGVEHHAFRRGQAGHVELWPLFENEQAEPLDLWEPAVSVSEHKSGAMLCADYIARQIQTWLESSEILQSHGRPIEPGDIMILLKSRSAFMNRLIRSLKLKNIPVSGHDRMVLQEELAVEDLIALADFCLLPDDDLALACVLKSPLIGLNEEQLLELCAKRNASLWHEIVHSAHYKNIMTYLMNLISKAQNLSVYDFFSSLLSEPSPASNSGWSAFAARLGLDCFDVLEEFLNLALAFDNNETSSLQNFIHEQKRDHVQIKRELEEAGGQVRIMTVHGSKGLQAPIVIMPDTIRMSRHVSGQSDKRLLWPQKTGLSVPLWSARKDADPDIFLEYGEGLEMRADAEYRRLLYVAMTRAEDRLYVTGYSGKKPGIEDSWYFYVQNGLKHADHVEELGDGLYRLTNPQIKDPDRRHDGKQSRLKDGALPVWLYEKAPLEPTPPRPLVPSRPSQIEPAALSPLQSQNNSRFKRGNLTHKLLEFLPDITPQKRRWRAEKFLERFAADIEEPIRQSIIHETFHILEHPKFSSFFMKGSRAEVPISGLVNDNILVSGQIDRLMITDNEIWIVDYKTNRPSPESLEHIPQIYLDQMKSYHDVLRTIYPDHQIHCALLWTDLPRLMPITFNAP